MKKVLIVMFLVIVTIAFAGRALLYWHGLKVTSWYRTPWHNYTVGGKWYSLHLIGWAYDVVPINTLLHAIRAIWPFKFLIESDHVHLQIF